MMRRLLAACIAIAVCSAAQPDVAFAAPAKDLGKDIADDAAVAFKDQRFQQAAELFEKAYALGADKIVRLRNAGRAWEEAGKLEYARTQFQKYLDKVKSGPDHDEVVQRLARLEARIADEKAQREAVEQSAKAIAEPANAIEPAAPAQVAVAAEPDATVREPGQKSNGWLGWTLIGGGAVLAAGGTALAVMTESANGRLNDQSAAGLYSADKLAEDRAVILRNRVAAFSLVGAGAAGIIVGAILTARSGHEPASQPSAFVTPAGGVGVCWSGRF